MKQLWWFLFFASTMAAQTAETVAYRAVLSPRNEIPAITDLDASGTGTFLLHLVRDAQGRVVSASAEYQVSYRFPGAISIIGMHIHRGTATDSGPVVINSTISADSPSRSEDGRGTIVSQFQIGPGDTNALAAVNGVLDNPAGFYLNLHTPANPGGAIRGQLMKAERIVLMSMMSTRNEVPPIADLNASGVTTITALRTLDAQGRVTSGVVTFDNNYNAFPEGTSLTGFHIHSGVAGANGPVIIDTGVTRNNAVTANVSGGSLHYDVEVNPAIETQVATLNGLFTRPENYYVNLHTAVNPGGAIRGQLRRTDRMTFPMNLLTSNEVPIPAVDAVAPSVITLHTIRDESGAVVAGTAIFDVNARFGGAATFIGLHIHSGATGVNGPVVIGTDLGQNDRAVPSSTGVVNIYRSVTVSNSAGLQALNGIMTAPENYYVNLHTVANPGGVVRAQMPTISGQPTISFAGSSNLDTARRTVAPGGLLTITGSNLMKVPGEPSASIPADMLPTNYNGTTVSVGGSAAPLLVAGRENLVVHVPSNIATGDQDVIVRTPIGATSPTRVPVSTVAPAIFFTDAGGIFLKNADFSLVTASNAARAGDIILVYSTGLPAASSMTSGQIVPLGQSDNPVFTSTVPVRVTVGSRDARVIYSILSPGFVGLSQTAFVVPEGVTAGAQPVVITAGSTASNSVDMRVQ